MASNSFGRFLRVTTFGESHGHGLGVVIDGLPAGLDVDVDAVQREMDRRRPGQSDITTPRNEADAIQVWSGLFEGRTTGTPLAIAFVNADQKSSAYEKLADVFRPGHADYTYEKKYGRRDPRGGGRSSGRETACRVAAGAIAKQLLAARGIRVFGHVTRVADIAASNFDEAFIEQNPVRTADRDAASKMIAAIEAARNAGDSLGAVVEVRAQGVPPGLGDPIYEKLDARLAFAIMSVGAIKGVEIGDGFASALMRGSEHNDAMSPDGFSTNHAGGVLGGISTGQPIVLRLAVKPASSIAKTQSTVNKTGEAVDVSVTGRHDPCIAPRVVPVAEAMVALVLADFLLAPPSSIDQIRAD